MNRTHTLIRVLWITGLLGLPGCDSGPEGANEAPPKVGGAAPTAMGGMPGMEGMSGTDMPAAGPMEEMRSRLTLIREMSPDRMVAAVPEYRQMAANLLAQMTREMQQMNMMGDSAWIATVDSIRQDLVEMPGLDTGQIQSFMAGHQVRMMRLIETHRSMMGNMGR